jgi:hypothetical protein
MVMEKDKWRFLERIWSKRLLFLPKLDKGLAI